MTFSATLPNFSSDYQEGAHARVLDALVATNMEQSSGYGTDEHCERARDLIREACQAPDADVYFLVGGTQTNATVIDAILLPWQGVIAPRGLPKDVLRTLETAMSEVVNSEAFQQEALRLKTKAHWMSSEAFRKLYDEELNTYGEILKHSLPQK